MYRVFFEDKFVDVEANDFQLNSEYQKVLFTNGNLVVGIFNFNNILGFTEIQEGE